MHLFPDLEPEQDNTEESSESDDLDRSKPLVLLLEQSITKESRAISRQAASNTRKRFSPPALKTGNRYWNTSISSRFARLS